MGFVTLYSYNPTPTVRRNVIRSDSDPTYISFTDFASVGSTPQPPVNQIVSVICFGVDQYTYKVQAAIPYAYFTKLPNAPECGYTPPTCDIMQVSFSKTDETASEASNGTANLFCSSSYEPITYYIGTLSGGIIGFNTTGYFTGLAPAADYYIDAIDTNGCEKQQRFEILPFDNTKTHFKYRLKFADKDGTTPFELRLYDMLHPYPEVDYPIDITGTDSPVIYKQSDQSEDKTTAIVSANIKASLWYTGLDFTPDEFNLAPEQSWFVQLYANGIVYFQGYIIPDENQDYYMDAPYMVTITATDGLPSLKGNSFGDGSGGNGFGTSQVQQYGLTQWCRLVKQCLDQLGYAYGDTILLSSLRHNNVFDGNLWLNIGTWSDILYDSSGVAVDTYTALTNLLAAVKLCIINVGERFALINWNDLSYINNGVVNTEYLKAYYQFAGDFSNINANGAAVQQPLTQSIGFDFPIQPINPPQNLNYDKPYNIEVDIDFSVLALLYENPSFEIGAVQGQLPPDMKVGLGSPDIFLNYDPLTPVLNSGAYDGNWELRTKYTVNTLATLVPPATIEGVGDYIEFINAVVIDQINQKINLSYNWRSNLVNANTNGIPGMALIFHDNATGDNWTWVNVPATGVPAWGLINPAFEPFINTMNANEKYIDNVWHSFNTTTAPLPGSQLGTLNIRIYPPYYYYPYPGGGGYHLPIGTEISVDIDDLNITAQDASDSLNLQIGETHTVTAVTGVPQANLKNVPLSLFTYPTNKRVAGNVFYGHDYATAPVQNLWNFALKSADKLDRLAATVAKSIGRNYAYPMRKFEGDVFAPLLQYYGVFIIKYIDGVVFAPFSIEGDLRNSKWHVVLIEITDQSQQAVYQYVPKYQKSARSNG